MATPDLRDPHFRRTVVYLVAHGDDGTVGVILNRPSETAVQNVLPALGVTHGAAAGGFRRRPGADVGGDVPGRVPDGDEPARGRRGGRRDRPGGAGRPGRRPDVGVAGALRGIRIYAGRAGWDAQQLVDEIVEGSWFVVPGLPDDVIAGPRTDLWFSVLRRQPFPLALMAYHPGDLTRN